MQKSTDQNRDQVDSQQTSKQRDNLSDLRLCGIQGRVPANFAQRLSERIEAFQFNPENQMLLEKAKQDTVLEIESKFKKSSMNQTYQYPRKIKQSSNNNQDVVLGQQKNNNMNNLNSDGEDNENENICESTLEECGKYDLNDQNRKRKRKKVIIVRKLDPDLNTTQTRTRLPDEQQSSLAKTNLHPLKAQDPPVITATDLTKTTLPTTADPLKPASVIDSSTVQYTLPSNFDGNTNHIQDRLIHGRVFPKTTTATTARQVSLWSGSRRAQAVAAARKQSELSNSLIPRDSSSEYVPSFLNDKPVNRTLKRDSQGSGGMIGMQEEVSKNITDQAYQNNINRRIDDAQKIHVHHNNIHIDNISLVFQGNGSEQQMNDSTTQKLGTANIVSPKSRNIGNARVKLNGPYSNTNRLQENQQQYEQLRQLKTESDCQQPRYSLNSNHNPFLDLGNASGTIPGVPSSNAQLSHRRGQQLSQIAAKQQNINQSNGNINKSQADKNNDTSQNQTTSSNNWSYKKQRGFLSIAVDDIKRNVDNTNNVYSTGAFGGYRKQQLSLHVQSQEQEQNQLSQENSALRNYSFIPATSAKKGMTSVNNNKNSFFPAQRVPVGNMLRGISLDGREVNSMNNNTNKSENNNSSFNVQNYINTNKNISLHGSSSGSGSGQLNWSQQINSVSLQQADQQQQQQNQSQYGVFHNNSNRAESSIMRSDMLLLSGRKVKQNNSLSPELNEQDRQHTKFSQAFKLCSTNEKKSLENWKEQQQKRETITVAHQSGKSRSEENRLTLRHQQQVQATALAVSTIHGGTYSQDRQSIQSIAHSSGGLQLSSQGNNNNAYKYTQCQPQLHSDTRDRCQTLDKISNPEQFHAISKSQELSAILMNHTQKSAINSTTSKPLKNLHGIAVNTTTASISTQEQPFSFIDQSKTHRAVGLVDNPRNKNINIQPIQSYYSDNNNINNSNNNYNGTRKGYLPAFQEESEQTKLPTNTNKNQSNSSNFKTINYNNNYNINSFNPKSNISSIKPLDEMSPSTKQVSGAVGYVPLYGIRDKPKRKVINVSNSQTYKNSKDIFNHNNNSFVNKNPYL